jgi:hypothetical protein
LFVASAASFALLRFPFGGDDDASPADFEDEAAGCCSIASFAACFFASLAA